MLFFRKKKQSPSRLERVRSLMQVCLEEKNWIKLSQAKMLEKRILLLEGTSHQSKREELAKGMEKTIKKEKSFHDHMGWRD